MNKGGENKMKKLIAGTALGVMLLGGFLFAQDSKQEEVVYGDVVPSILSVQKPDVYM